MNVRVVKRGERDPYAAMRAEVANLRALVEAIADCLDGLKDGDSKKVHAIDRFQKVRKNLPRTQDVA